MEIKSLAIGSDHAGYDLKEYLKKYLEMWGYVVEDYGTYSSDSVDYPDFAHPVAKSVNSGMHTTAILICGSGQGVCITANKYERVRAALCWTEELAELTRQHNNSNILCLPARFVDNKLALRITEKYLNTDFEGGRHDRRVKKIATLNN
jgi:ribose 5-phosphate isomerase B